MFGEKYDSIYETKLIRKIAHDAYVSSSELLTRVNVLNIANNLLKEHPDDREFEMVIDMIIDTINKLDFDEIIDLVYADEISEDAIMFKGEEDELYNALTSDKENLKIALYFDEEPEFFVVLRHFFFEGDLYAVLRDENNINSYYRYEKDDEEERVVPIEDKELIKYFNESYN